MKIMISSFSLSIPTISKLIYIFSRTSTPMAPKTRSTSSKPPPSKRIKKEESPSPSPSPSPSTEPSDSDSYTPPPTKPSKEQPHTKGNPPPNAKFPSPDIDYRAHPHLYQISRAEVGVLTCEPYKSEILPLWRFRTPAIAETSSVAIREKYNAYKDDNDFIGMDMCRKFLQMGYTRAMRYANHVGGRKYDSKGGGKREMTKTLEGQVSEEVRRKCEEKKEAAGVFKVVWKEVADSEEYIDAKARWQAWKKDELKRRGM